MSEKEIPSGPPPSYEESVGPSTDNGNNLYPNLPTPSGDSKPVSSKDLNGNDPHGIELMIKATDFAARRHRFQKRKDNRTPYVNHPIGESPRNISGMKVMGHFRSCPHSGKRN